MGQKTVKKILVFCDSPFPTFLTLYCTKGDFKKLLERGLLKARWAKEKNAYNQHFLLYPQCFLPYQRKIAPLRHIQTVAFKCFEFGQS